MKIRGQDLEARLARKPEPMVLVRGDDPLLCEEAADVVRAAARHAGFAQSQRHIAEQYFNWNDFFAEFYSPSLFAPRVLHELRLTTGKVAAAGSEILRQLLQHKNATSMLLIVAVQAERSVWDTAWAKAFEDEGLVAQVDRPEGAAALEWLRRRMDSRGLRAAPAVIERLAYQMEGNFLALAQEVDKLRLLVGDGPVTEEDLEQVIGDQSRYTLFAWVDACLAGKAAAALHILARLQAEGTEPILLLHNAARELRGLIQMAAERSRGTPLAKLFASHRVWSRRQPLVSAILARMPASRLMALLQHCARIDKILKGRTPGQLWLELEALTLGFAG